MGRFVAAGWLCLLLVLGAAPASATPIMWNLVETSCVSFSSSFACKAAIPLVIGQVGGTGVYHSDGLGGFSKSGSDFLAIFGGAAGNYINVSSGSGAFCGLGSVCSLTISLTDMGAGGISGSIDFQNFETAISLALNGTAFSASPYGSDGTLIGCGSFANCQIAGVLTQVPEPPTLAIFGFFVLVFIARISSLGRYKR